MIDFSVTECSKGMYLYCFAFFLLIFSVYWKKYSGFCKSLKLDILFFLLILAYVTTSFYNGDFWHLQDYIVNENQLWKPSEPIYDTISDFVGDNYLLFRIIVWGGALVLIIKIFKRYSLNINTTLYYFFALYISVFDYARVSLAMAIYFFGFVLFTNVPKKFSLWCKVLGVTLMLLSVVFHTSLLAVILLTFIIWLPLNKKTLIFLAFAFPIFSLIIKFVVFDIILGGAGELIMYKISGIIDADMGETTTMERIRLMWHYSTFYIPFIIVSYLLFFKNDVNHFPKSILKLYKITLSIIVLATSTLFLGTSSKVLFYRFLYMSMIPLTVLMCYLKETGVLSLKMYKKIMIYGALYLVFRHTKVLLRWSGPLS